jgi:hypothetical protein
MDRVGGPLLARPVSTARGQLARGRRRVSSPRSTATSSAPSSNGGEARRRSTAGQLGRRGRRRAKLAGGQLGEGARPASSAPRSRVASSPRSRAASSARGRGRPARRRGRRRPARRGQRGPALKDLGRKHVRNAHLRARAVGPPGRRRRFCGTPLPLSRHEAVGRCPRVLLSPSTIESAGRSSGPEVRDQNTRRHSVTLGDRR